MQQVVPALRMTDYGASKAFYTEGLGFDVLWEHRFGPNFPVFVEVGRDGVNFYLSEHEGDCQVGGLTYLFVPDVDSWYRELTTRGVAVAPPNEDLEGLRTMTVVDPDGKPNSVSPHA